VPEEAEHRELKFKTFDQFLKKAILAAEGQIDHEDNLSDEGVMTDDGSSESDNEPTEQQKQFKEFLM